MYDTPRRTNGARSFFKWIILSILAAVSLLTLYFFYLLAPVSESEEIHSIIIDQGDGLSLIADRLHEEGVIRSPAAFTVYSVLSGAAHRLKPGTYALNSSFPLPRIVQTLRSGLPNDISVLIVEGATLKEIDTLLSAFGIIPMNSLNEFPWPSLKEDYPFLEFARSLEGFLFPDTYRFFPNSEPEDVVRKLLDNWQRQVWPHFQEQIVDGAPDAFYESMIVASILEKEVPYGDDRRLVTGVINRRLAIGMALQVDASLVYAKCDGVFQDCPTLTRADLKEDSFYNTYTRRGLPPTPISNPGRDAVQSALHPVSSSYLYYLSDPVTKRTIFATTLEEHNENKAHYLR
jgi:UPF0755 protein